MPYIVKPLTNTEVKQSKPREKVYALSDGDGLSLRVKPNGSKLWLFNYTAPYTKKRTCLSFASYPELSIANARCKRQNVRELLAKNIDPKEQRDEELRIKETGNLEEWLTKIIGADTREAEIIKKVLSEIYK